MIAELTALSAVFSAYAEVVRIVPADGNRQEGILRVRGGSSLVYKKQFGDHVYSPRTRR